MTGRERELRSPLPRARRVAAARRAFCAAAFALLALAAGPAPAQSAQTSVVQKAARDWLAIADANNADKAWQQSGAQFRKAITVERFAEGLAKERAPRGALVQRSVTATQFDRTFRKLPEGDYALVTFRTAYAKQATAAELVTLERESDGVWRVIGYVIR
jgi:hypothetical protein